ncbi:MAG: Na+ dependent nucleoside transporter, partial [Bacteroidia bacterium]|nr:Na+ dependent nucleoside transporter [Bacteroidia bacterium]
MKRFWLAVTAIFFALAQVNSQSIEKEWRLETAADGSVPIINAFDITQLSLKTGAFEFSNSKGDIEASGDYIFQDPLLIFYFDQPLDTIRRFRVQIKTDSTLVLAENEKRFSLKQVEAIQQPIVESETSEASDVIPSQGFSMNSLMRGALGMFVLLLLSFLLSKNRKAINWRTVGFGLLAQLALAVGVLKVAIIQKAFEFVGKIFVKILDFTMSGTEFLFKSFITDKIEDSLLTFAVSILPTIVFFSALTSVLFYLGIIQKVVKGMAWLLTKLLQISGAESLSVAGNIFLGQTESPLMIKAYLEKMTKSEILLVMIGGMATVAGGVLAAYIGFLGGEDAALKIFYAKHLLTASVMAAPGAIVISKMLYPQMDEINSDLKITQDNIGSNILDAIANGTTEGLKLAVNVGAMLLVFLAFIAMINFVFIKVGSLTGLNDWILAHTPYDGLSLEYIL